MVIHASSLLYHTIKLCLHEFVHTLHKNVDAFHSYKPQTILYQNNGLIAAEIKSDTHKLTSKRLKEDLHKKLLY